MSEVICERFGVPRYIGEFHALEQLSGLHRGAVGGEVSRVVDGGGGIEFDLTMSS